MTGQPAEELNDRVKELVGLLTQARESLIYPDDPSWVVIDDLAMCIRDTLCG